MMKRLLFVLIICLSISRISVIAQCVPNTNITQPGIYPDSATGLSPGVINQTYNQVMQIKVPTDTTAVISGNTVALTVDSIYLLAFTNLPPGLTYACNPANCTFPGGSNGCVLISGTPTATGTYHPVAITRTSVHATNLPILTYQQTDTINYYTIVINLTNGIAATQNLKFDLFQNDPNPFSNYTDLKFSTPHQMIVTLKVFNLIGKEIMHKAILCQGGHNIYRLQGDDFAPGVYMYTLSDGITTYTRRMIYSKR